MASASPILDARRQCDTSGASGAIKCGSRRRGRTPEAACRALLSEQGLQFGEQFVGRSLRAALLEDNLAVPIKERHRHRMVEAALTVRLVGDAQGGGELPPRA